MCLFCGNKIKELEKKVEYFENSLDYLSDVVKDVRDRHFDLLRKLPRILQKPSLGKELMKKYIFLHREYNGTFEFKVWTRGESKCETYIFEDRKIYELTDELYSMLDKRLYDELECQRRCEPDLNKRLIPSFRLIEIKE